MTDLSNGPELELTDAELEAIERDYGWKTHSEGQIIVRLTGALRKEKERVASLETDLEKIQRLYLSLYEQDPRAKNFQECIIVREPDGARFTLTIQRVEGMTPGAVAAEAKARAERAEARVAELEAELDEEEKATAHKHDLLRDAWDDRDEWRTRADRAEAACARMRAALETARSVIGHVCKVEWSSEMRCFACLYDTALATDIGSGWVSPTVHAEVVAERTARAEKAESERDAVLRAKTTNDLELVRVQKRLATVTKERDEARAEHQRTCQAVALGERADAVELSAQLAECQAQAASVRETLARARAFVRRHATDDHPLLAEIDAASDAGKALAGRVRLLEAAFEVAEELLAEVDEYQNDHRGVAPADRWHWPREADLVQLHLREKLAAVRAHDAAERDRAANERDRLREDLRDATTLGGTLTEHEASKGARAVLLEKLAEVTKERDEARAFGESWRLAYMTVADAIAPRSENAAQLAKAVRELRNDAKRHYDNATKLAKECGDLRAEVESLESYKRGLKQRKLIEGLPLPPQLVERVRLLEAVVENVRLHGCRHIVAGSVTANCTGRVCRALAALDAHDAAQGGAK